MFADYVGVAHAVSVPHCTAALHLALAALGDRPGRRGDRAGRHLDRLGRAGRLRRRRAGPGRHPARHLVPRSRTRSQRRSGRAPRRSSASISTARPATGTACRDRRAARPGADRGRGRGAGLACNGRRAGAFGDVSAFSFHGSKTVATGEGGMLVTDDDGVVRRVLMLRDHGRQPGDRFFLNDEIAFKYKMSAVKRRSASAQMERIEALIERKRAIFGWYRDRLGRTERRARSTPSRRGREQLLDGHGRARLRLRLRQVRPDGRVRQAQHRHRGRSSRNCRACRRSDEPVRRPNASSRRQTRAQHAAFASMASSYTYRTTTSTEALRRISSAAPRRRSPECELINDDSSSRIFPTIELNSKRHAPRHGLARAPIMRCSVKR